MSNTKHTLPIYNGDSAEVKEISLDKEKRTIIVKIKAKGSVYVEEPTQYGFPQLMNSAPIVEGFNLILKHGHHAVNAIKGESELQKLYKENERLRCLLSYVADFENGSKVTIKGLTYQKSINEHSFYMAIKQATK